MSGNSNQPTDVGSVDTFHLTLQAADIGLWRWDLHTGRVELSPTAGSLLGFSVVQRLDYTGFIASIHPDDRPFAERALHSVVAEAGRFDFEARAATTGRRFRVRGQGFADGDHAGEVAGILIDVGPRPAVEGPIGRLAAIVASSDDAIIGEDLDGIITDWNRGAEVILGYTAAEAIGRPLSMLSPSGQEDEMAGLLERIKAGERIEHFETRRRRKDGAIIDVSLTTSPVWDDAGRLVGASKVARDITATKRAQAELEAREAHLRSVLELDTGCDDRDR